MHFFYQKVKPLKTLLLSFHWRIFILIGLMIGSAGYWTNSDAFKTWKKERERVQLAQVLQQYQRKPLLPEDIKKMPKKDRPDLALEQDIMMTLDPKLGYVPHERKLKALKEMKNRLAKSPIPDVNWEERGPDNVAGRTRALMFDPNDATNRKVWAGSVSGGLWYNDNITSVASRWQRVDDFWSNIAIASIAYDPTNPQVFYVGTGEYWAGTNEATASGGVQGAGIWKSIDAGQTWEHLTSTTGSSYYYVNKIVVTSTGRVVIATSNGLRTSDNGGNSWTTRVGGTFSDIEIAANGDLYAGRLNGIIQKSTNNATSWSTVHSNLGGARVELATAPSNADVVYAIGSNNSTVAWVKKTTNGGGNWSSLTIPRYLEQNCAASSSDFTRNQAYYDISLGIHPLDEDVVLMGGIDVLRTTNGGSSWSTRSYWTGACGTYVHADQHAVVFRPGAGNENTAIVGTDGGVFYSTDVGNAADGSTVFLERNRGYNVTQFYGCAVAPEANRNYFLAGAQDNGSQRFNSAGINSTFEVTGGDGGYCYIDQDNSNIQITSYVYNIFYRSSNGGNSFNTIANDETTGLFISPGDYDDDANLLYSSANQNQVFRVSTTGASNAGALSVSGGLGGGVATAIKVSPHSDHVLFVGTWTGNVYRVRNANTTPVSTNIDTGNDLPGGWISSIDIGADENHLLVTMSNYGINSVWETKDGGSSWQNKEGNLPDIPVRWGIFNPNSRQQVMIATEMGVWSTENISATSPDWSPTNEGLGNVKCTMLEFRPSDNLVTVSTYGRGLFTAYLGDFCAPPTDLSISETTEGEAVINWGLVPEALNYNVRYKLTTATDWVEVNDIIGTTMTITGLENCLFYEFEVNAVCGIYTTPYSNPFEFVSFCEELLYCSISGNASSDWVESVQFNEINNTSGSDGGYGNYRNLSATVEAGETYTITLTPGYSSIRYPEKWRVWIDWNLNSLHEADELVVFTPEESNEAITESIVVPNDVTSGNTVMRIMMTGDDGIEDPCFNEDSFFGEVEDYTITITGPCAIPTNLSQTSASGTTTTLEWNADPDVLIYSVRYRVVGSDEWENTLTTNTNAITIVDLLQCSVYEWQVKADCTDGFSSPFTTTQTFASNCDLTTVQLKVLLEGPFFVNKMATNLNNVLLTNQPYDIAPWMYSGVENVTAMGEDMTDWVLIQATDVNYNIIETKAALLKEDGSVWDVTGTEGVRFETLTEGIDYHFVIRHRNHLDIISKTPLPINNDTPYDFTNPANVLGGADQLIPLSTGAYAMIVGDMNGDGVINVNDFNDLQEELGQSGVYNDADLDFDTNVITSDFNKYRPNAAKIGVSAIRY